MNDDYMRAVGERLCRLRTEKGWSQEIAAREVGVSVTTWRAWETGRREPYAQNWARLSEAFNVPVDRLRKFANEGLEERVAKLEAQVADLLKRLESD
jgi:transcriptional regulator with XRE-family HTH domain